MPGPFVDVHAHLTPPEYIAALEALVEAAGDGLNPDERGAAGHDGAGAAAALAGLAGYDHAAFTDLEVRREGLAAAGIRHQLLSFVGPAVGSTSATRARLAATCNDGFAAVVGRDPERFSFAAKLPLGGPALDPARSGGSPLDRKAAGPDADADSGTGSDTDSGTGTDSDVDLAVAEYRRASALGARAVGLPMRVGGEWLDPLRYGPLFAALDDDRAIVALHPTGELGQACGWPEAAWPVGAPFEDLLCLLLLLREDVLAAFPQIRWIVPHLGGVLPFLYDRLEAAAGQLGANVGRLLCRRQVFFDVANPQPGALALAAATLGAERLVFGTDYPYAQRQLGPASSIKLLTAAGLGADDADLVAYGNAEELLDLFGPDTPVP